MMFDEEKIYGNFQVGACKYIQKNVDCPLKKLALLIYMDANLSKNEALKLTFGDLVMDNKKGRIHSWMEYSNETPENDLQKSTLDYIKIFYNENNKGDNELIFLNPRTNKKFSTSWFTKDLAKANHYGRYYLVSEATNDIQKFVK